MKEIGVTFITECIKLRRSVIFSATIIVFIIVPLMLGLMMFVARNPEMAAKLGMVGTKATLFGRNDWSGFLGLLLQTIATIGYIGFGFATSWIFGRESTDRTLKDILALPVSRSSIVISKFLVIFLWCTLLSIILFSTGLLTGRLIGVPGWSSLLISGFTEKFFITSFLTFLLCTPVAFLASYGRGIIAPTGFLILTLVMAQFLGLVGFGPYFPWAIPGIYTVSVATDGMRLFSGSYIILGLTSIIGFVATVRWWKNADHH